MLGSNGKKKSQKNQYMGLISKKKKTLHVQHTFVVHFFTVASARLQRETSRNFLVTRFMKEILLLFTFFFVATHFHFGGR